MYYMLYILSSEISNWLYLRCHICRGRYDTLLKFLVFAHPDRYNKEMPPVRPSLKFERGSCQKESAHSKTNKISGPKMEVQIADNSRRPRSIWMRIQLRLPILMNKKVFVHKLFPLSNNYNIKCIMPILLN